MDTLFWVLGKLFWIFFSPMKFIPYVFILGLILLGTRFKKSGIWMISGGAVFIVLLSFMPVLSMLGLPLEERFSRPDPLPARPDGIIVLAGSEERYLSHIRKTPSLNEAGERLVEFVSLARRFPEAKLLFTGGSGSLAGQHYKSSHAAAKVFEQLGLDLSRVQFESESRTTAESAFLSYQQISPKKGEKWILITSALHVPRSVGVFRKAGWEVIPYPVDYRTTGKNYLVFNLYLITSSSAAIHEWLGILAYWLKGKTSEFFPGPP
jgi:uncharacterized SAM-binding protein YcdF (DUF218 family)